MESRIAEEYSLIKWKDGFSRIKDNNETVYINSNGYLHNLFGPCIIRTLETYIHEFYAIDGEIMGFREWEEKTHIDRNRLEILNEI